MREVYLDYSATTPVKEDVVKEMIPYYTEKFGNPSSLYAPGLAAKEGLDKARVQVAELINAEPNEIFFTSCGTEADNWVLEGVADALKKKGNHIITTTIEHHAILHTCQYMEKHGVEVTYLDVDNEGFVNPEDLKAALRDETVLVSIMMVNNEVGTVQPIKELAAIAHEKGVYFHTDAVQAIGNVPVDVKDLDVDFISMSAHKIYGPKGVGALYKRKGITIPNFIHGGAQERKKRAGTENAAGIVGFGKAAELAKAELDRHIAHSRELRAYLWDIIQKEIPDVHLNGPEDFTKRHPGNLSVSFDYIEGEAILLRLDACGISVSTGSACSSSSLGVSHVLEAIRVPITRSNGTIRFTVGDFTTKEDIEYVGESLKKVVELLRELSPVNGMEGW
ncbi:MAG: cysteine desulfurase NifS [Clostridiales bacterium]|nr:cysteine desulfurase NifS [Clostridiales bacterium]MDD7034746.1 cysteine desulfurase NifS [Bacillota bacterium]MDY2919792.1 cysteine desulfurase NifS [Lentihominibacter sp.]